MNILRVARATTTLKLTQATRSAPASYFLPISLRVPINSLPCSWFSTSRQKGPDDRSLLIAVCGGALILSGLAYATYWIEPVLEASVAPKGFLGLQPLPEDTAVIFVLGGPGSGKGTQCSKIVKDYGFVHLSAGDLLREERKRPNSPVGELINTYIKEGQIVPMEITIALLHKAMKNSRSKRFLIDGFPRALDQGLKFEREVCKSKYVLYFECPEEEMLKRLLKRGETSGRVDDNIESIRKRFVTFKETSMPVIDYYAKQGIVGQISCKKPVDEVYKDVRLHIAKALK
ncbi:bifunctional uridylate/adenylate kinase [Nowakowskiella sp. JEL0078]|nr:bifunctional uridylate/adenylate kinase [Nowakowskiella sp. JEL0078]